MSGARRGEHGQAHILVVLATAIAALAVVGLVAAQEQLLGTAHDRRAGEASAQAAGAVVADEHLALVLSLRDGAGLPRDPDAAELRRFLDDPGLGERALAAARNVARENDGPVPREVAVLDRGRQIEISVHADAWHRVSIEKVSCCPR